MNPAKQFYAMIARWTAIAFAITAAFPQASARNNDAGLKSARLDINDGLANNSVTAICQAENGLIWLGTLDGLGRYDGYEFRNFRNQPGDSTSLSDNRIASLAECDGKIWVGTKKGLCVYNPATGAFAKVSRLDPQTGETSAVTHPINSITVHGTQVWVGTAGEGLLRAEADANTCKPIPASGRDGASDYGYHAQDICFDRTDRMWVFVQGMGVMRYNPETETLETVFSERLSASSMTFDDEDNLWIGLDKGMLQYNTQNGEYTVHHYLVDYPVKDVAFFPERQQIWAATDGNGVVGYDLNARRLFMLRDRVEEHALEGCNSVYSLLRDSQGNGWIGTLRAGVRIVGTHASMFRTVLRNPCAQSSLPDNYILSFCEDGDGRVWIGTDGSGVSLWDRDTDTFTNYRHHPGNRRSLPGNYVTSIARTEHGTWFGTYGGGIGRFDPANNTFVPYMPFNTKTGHRQPIIWAMLATSKGVLWGGSSNGEGLYRHDPATDAFQYMDVPVRNVLSMAEDDAGNLWIGGFAHLTRLDSWGNSIAEYPVDYPVRAIRPHNKNCVLLGMEGGGLTAFDPTTGLSAAYLEKDGLANNTVLGIVAQGDGVYWLSTYNGLSRFEAESGRFTNFHASDGLQANQFSYNASLGLSDGSILMGGICGFNVISPGIYASRTGFPRLCLTGLSVDGVPFDGNPEKVRVRRQNPLLTVDFTALEFLHPDKIAYEYMLEGWDRGWIRSPSRQAIYSRLKSGRYTFKVRSTDAAGAWNPDELSFPVVIRPPWYNTVWTWIVYLLAAGYVAYRLFDHRRVKKQLEEDVRLAVRQAEMDRQLNEKKLNFFAALSYEFRSPLTMILNPLREMHQEGRIDAGSVELAYRSSQRLLAQVNRLLLFRKSDSYDQVVNARMDISRIARETYDFYARKAAAKGIEFMRTDELKDPIVCSDSEKIEICFSNLVSNAVKFTPRGGRVTIGTEGDERTVRIFVSDTGPGIPPPEREHIFELFYQGPGNRKKASEAGFGVGLYTADKLARELGGTVALEEHPQGGSIFTLILPRGSEEGAVGMEHEGVSSLRAIEQETDDHFDMRESAPERDPSKEILHGRKRILIVDGDRDHYLYLEKILSSDYETVHASDAAQAFESVGVQVPDMVVTEAQLEDMSDAGLCALLKDNPDTRHIPVVVLTVADNPSTRLASAEAGADDFIPKPFDKDYLLARIGVLFRQRTNLQAHLLGTVAQSIPISAKLTRQEKEFIDRVVHFIEENLEEEINIPQIASRVGMSTSLLYKRIKQLTGRSVIDFARFIRLRKAATELINSDMQVSEIGNSVGFNDIKYFRKLFIKQYGLTPSAFRSKYRVSLQDKEYTIDD